LNVRENVSCNYKKYLKTTEMAEWLWMNEKRINKNIYRCLKFYSDRKKNWSIPTHTETGFKRND
jgi:hypothetical protein